MHASTYVLMPMLMLTLSHITHAHTCVHTHTHAHTHTFVLGILCLNVFAIFANRQEHNVSPASVTNLSFAAAASRSLRSCFLCALSPFCRLLICWNLPQGRNAGGDCLWRARHPPRAHVPRPVCTPPAPVLPLLLPLEGLWCVGWAAREPTKRQTVLSSFPGAVIRVCSACS